MFQPQTNEQSRKTFLSPECLKNMRIIRSPKFDKEKALKDQMKRKLIYQEKLARYDSYNSILSAKAKQEIGSFGNKMASQHHIKKDQKKNQPKLKNDQNIFTYLQQKKGLVKKSQQPTKQAKQKKIQQLRQKNKTLHTKNTQLKSYLKEINCGVTELECILQQVEVTYNRLNQVNPQFKGLWILKQHQEQEEEYIKSEKNTKDTIDFQYDRRIYPKKILQNDHSLLKLKGIDNCLKNDSDKRLQAINSLQKKFRGILTKIEKRQLCSNRIDVELHELSKIQKQLDEIKKSSIKTTLNNSKSQKIMQTLINEQNQFLPNRNLNKVKSLERILS